MVLPSPLLPAAAYQPLVDGLVAAGAETAVADPSLSGTQTPDDLVLRWARDARGADVLVPHSNAGYFAPAVRKASGTSVRIVFMDAALPPESGATRLAPPGLRTHLAGLADERGLLPPWTRWWPRAALADVVPDELFDAIDRACPRLPERYFDHSVTAPAAWVTDLNAYLAFGSTYEAELDFADSHGWPTRLVDGGHLHFLHQPTSVSESLLSLAGELLDRGR